jgi:Protein of unknown function (DUF2934)
MPRPKSPRKKNNGVSQTVSVRNPPLTEDVTSEVVEAPPAGTFETRSTEMKTTPRARKSDMLKADSRSNLIPINIEEEIRRLAYLLSERRGFEPGHETEDWLVAEREIRERYHQYTA